MSDDKKENLGESTKVVKASIWYTASNFLLKGMAFLTTPIFARILTQGEYGYFNNFNAWLGIFSIIATLSLVSCLNRARFDFKDTLDDYVSSNLVLGSLVTILVGGIVFLFRGFFQNICTLDIEYFILIFVYLLVSPAYEMFLQLERFRYKYTFVAIMTMALSVGTVLISLVLVFQMRNRLWGRTLGSLALPILISLVIYAMLLCRGKHIKFSYWKYSLGICIPFVFHLLSSTLLNSSDRAMISNICGTESNGLYGMAANVAMIAYLLWSAMGQAYLPWFGEQMNHKNYELIRKNSHTYIGIFAFVILGLMLFTPEGLLILGGKDYLMARDCVPPITVGYLFVFLYSLYVNIEQFQKKTIGMAICTSIAAGVNVLLNAILLPKFGYIAAAYTTLVGYILLFVLHFLIVHRMKLTEVYDTKFNLIVSIGMLGASFLILLLYRYDYLRWGLDIIYLILFGVVAKKYIVSWKKKKQQ